MILILFGTGPAATILALLSVDAWIANPLHDSVALGVALGLVVVSHVVVLVWLVAPPWRIRVTDDGYVSLRRPFGRHWAWVGRRHQLALHPYFSADATKVDMLRLELRGQQVAALGRFEPHELRVVRDFGQQVGLEAR